MKNSRSTHPNSKEAILRARTFSSKSVRIGICNWSWRGFRLLMFLSLIGSAAWGTWLGFDKVFLSNPEFQLRHIELNSNPVLNTADLIELAQINPNSPPNLFRINAKDLTSQLLKNSAIQSAVITRKPPHTLCVKITAHQPAAWLTCSNSDPNLVRAPGQYLISQEGVSFVCPEPMLSSCLNLPIIISNQAPQPRQDLSQDQSLRHALHLLDSCEQFAPDFLPLIHSIQQNNTWSLLVTLRDTTQATFGLGNHEDQFNRLRVAINHSLSKHYSLATINLIPKYNVPITIRNEQSSNLNPNLPPNQPISNPSSHSQDVKSVIKRTP